MGHHGEKTHAKGIYFILRYMYTTKNFGIAVLTVFKVPATYPPNNVDNEGTDKGHSNQHCTGGRGGGEDCNTFACALAKVSQDFWSGL